MKSPRSLLAGCVLTLVAVSLAAQEEEKPAWFSIGPRLGVTGVVMTPEKFNTQMQEVRSRDFMYFPVYSQIGLALEQRVLLTGAGTALVFRELGLVGGLDQNLSLFSGTLLTGIALGALEIAVGPEVGLDATGADQGHDPRTVSSLALGVTWVLHPWGRPFPVSLVAVPLWGEWEPRFTLLAGFDFPIRIRKTDEKPPFNY